ncbi:MAG: hypothetical protein ACO4CG_11635 [Prochlorothrix sp.]
MINSLLQSIKEKFSFGKGESESGGSQKASKKKGGKCGTIKRKPLNEIDSEWAAAIEAINAASQGKSADQEGSRPDLPDLPDLPNPPQPIPSADEDEKPTEVSSGPLPFPTPPPSAPPPAPGKKPRSSSRVAEIVTVLSQQPGLGNLTTDDFEAIHAYISQRSNMDKEERKQTSLNLARQMKTTMEMAKLPQKMSADLFLEALNAIHQDHS